MPAVVVNDEQPHHNPCCQDRQRHDQPIGHRQTEVHQIPEGRIVNERVDDLPDAPPDRWLLILGHNLFPDGIVWPGCTCRRNWIIFVHHNSSLSYRGLTERWRAKSGKGHIEENLRSRRGNSKAQRQKSSSLRAAGRGDYFLEIGNTLREAPAFTPLAANLA